MSNDETPPSDEESERRWIISVAVSSRPDLTVDALTSVLAESGFTVTPRELGSDLTALGYQVETEADGTAMIRPGPDGPITPAEPPSATAAEDADPGEAAAAGAHAFNDADPASLGDDPDGEAAPAAAKEPGYGNILGLPSGDGPPKPLLLIGAAVVAIILLIVAIVVFTGGDDDSNVDANGSTTTEPGDGATAGGKGLVARVTPGLEAGAIIRSGFDKDSLTSLGNFSSRGAWLAVNGKWAVQGGKAVVVTQSNGSAATLAIAPVKAPNLILNVHIPSTNGATGLAFRVKDAKNFWMLLLSKKYGTLSLLRVTGGRAKQVADAGLIHLPRLDVSLGVKADGASIIGYLQGNQVLEGNDPDSATAGGGFGLAATARADKATFDTVAFKDLGK